MSSAAQTSSETIHDHEMRITSHGKIRAMVEFALKFLQENPGKPLILHTLPASKGKGKEKDVMTEPPVHETGSAQPEKGSAKEKQRMPSTVSTIPKLMSVVEIIKREYLKTLDPATAPNGRLLGLHQYNEIGALDTEEKEDATLTPQGRRKLAIIEALQGKRHVRQNKVPYMRITLCSKELPGPITNGATYQLPETRTLSKSARSRLKKKLRTTTEPGE